MTDILEALRNLGSSTDVEIWEIVDEAADTIESLRARVAELEESNCYLARLLNDEIGGGTFMGEPVLKAGQGEPVVTKGEKGLTLHVGWDDLPAGTKLYTQAPPIPEGWQLVPIEPTREMLEAGYFTTSAANRSVWMDMLSASKEYKWAGSSDAIDAMKKGTV